MSPVAFQNGYSVVSVRLGYDERTDDSVSGTACGGCEQTVEDALAELSGVTGVDANHEADSVTVTGDADEERIAAAVREAGYDPA